MDDLNEKNELQKLNQELNERLEASEDALALDGHAEQKTQKGQQKGIPAPKTGRKKRKSSSIRRMQKESKKRIRVWKVVLSLFVVLVAGAAGGLFGMRWIGKNSLMKHEGVEDVEITAPEGVELEEEGKLVTYNGKKYRRNEDVISILCMGIDQEQMQEEGRVAGENGQADSLFIIALNTDTGHMDLINISRDSMVDVDLYNTQNEYVDTQMMQICLSYAYGDGAETSCENAIKSVSRLLYGMPIDAYAAIDMPAISVLNDAVGGVEVDVLENLTEKDPALVEGARVLLLGNQAEIYVRSRETQPADANNARMARQRQYLTNFIAKVLSATKKDITVPLSLYQTISSYMVTDITPSEVTYLASLVLQGGYSGQEIINIPGEVTMGETYAEYYVDEEALYEIILDVYYNEETE